MGRKAITNEVFVEKMLMINPNILFLNKYIQRTQKMKCQCKVCGHIWETFPCNLLNGCRCRNCLALINRKTHCDFLNEMKTIHPTITVLDKYINAHTKLEVSCNICNWKWYSSPDNLINNRRGCPNCTKSLGELSIQYFLDKYKINYIQQYKFDDLFGVCGGKLSYDFYISKYNILIEFQGRQHKKAIEYFGGEEQLKVQKEHDMRKRIYAKEHNIELLEIWYYEFNKIEDILNCRLLKQSA